MPSPTFTALTRPPFQPALRFIANITRSNPAVVTTTIAHLYNTGLIARLYIPQDFVMYQADQQFAAITVLNDTQFAIALDTQTYDAFVNPGNNLARAAMVVPIGQIPQKIDSAFDNKLPNANPIFDAPIPVRS